jgi:hypothetical protein
LTGALAARLVEYPQPGVLHAAVLGHVEQVWPGAAVLGQGVDPVLLVLDVVHPGQVGAEGEVVAQVVEDLELADTSPGTVLPTCEHQPDEARSRPGEQVHLPARHGSVVGPVGDGLPPATVG